jgi:hypothetical protein
LHRGGGVQLLGKVLLRLGQTEAIFGFLQKTFSRFFENYLFNSHDFIAG